MFRTMLGRRVLVYGLGAIASGVPILGLGAQQPALPGQDAYGAIAEIVAVLEADSTTDWSRVDLAALREHLIDMNEVTLRSIVRQEPLPDGVSLTVTGSGRTVAALRRMLAEHARALSALPDYRASAEPITNGVRMVVRATGPNRERVAVKIRGLGFAGLLTVGAHHPSHHLALARGEAMSHEH